MTHFIKQTIFLSLIFCSFNVFSQEQHLQKSEACINKVSYSDFNFYILKETGKKLDYSNLKQDMILWHDKGYFLKTGTGSIEKPQYFDYDPIKQITSILHSAVKSNEKEVQRLWNDSSISYKVGNKQCIVSFPFNIQHIKEIKSSNYPFYKNQPHEININKVTYIVNGDPTRIFLIPLSFTGYIPPLYDD